MPGEWTVITGRLSFHLWSMGTFSTFLCLFALIKFLVNWKSHRFRVKSCRFLWVFFVCLFVFFLSWSLPWYIFLSRWQTCTCAERVSCDLERFLFSNVKITCWQRWIQQLVVISAVFQLCHNNKPSSGTIILRLIIRNIYIYIFGLPPQFWHDAHETLGIS